MAGLRDLECGSNIALMDKLGRFNREFIMYGCAYMEDGKLKYLVSSKEDSIYDFIGVSAVNNIYPTPVMSTLESCPVPSGTKEDIAQAVKIQLAKDMREKYSEAYFIAIGEFAEQPANDNAYELLINLREQLEGLFDGEKLQLFEGLVKLAYEAKVLTNHSYEQMHNWLKKTRAQMEDDVVVKDIFERTFYGFAYENKDGKLAYFVNAQKAMVCEKKVLYEQQLIFTTPIFAKSYWFDYSGSVKGVKDEYLKKLQQVMDGAYIDLVKAIKKLPAAIDQEAFLNQLELNKKSCSQEAVAAFIGYGYRWNVM